MPQRHLLYLDASAMQCFYWKQGHVRLVERFEASDEGVQAFARYVRTYQKAVFSLLVDVADEGFHFESLPHVTGPDRKAMLKRKTDQAFFASPMSTAISLGRERTGRRDERFLFLGLTRQASLEPWLEVLRAHEVALNGVFTPPLVIDRLVRHFKNTDLTSLLVSFAPGGMRQTFMERGRVRFSRLAQSLDDIPIGLEDQCAAEILKTHSYLVGQRLIPRSAPLTVQLLVDEADFKRLRPALVDSADLRYLHLSLTELAARLGLHQPLRGSSAQPLLLHSLAREAGIAQLAPANETRFYGIWRMRQAIVGASVAIFFGAVLYAGKVWFDGQQMIESTVMARRQAAQQEAQLQQLEAGRPRMPVPTADLRAAVDELRRLEAGQTSPGRWMAHLSRALDQHPGIRLTRIDWRVTETDAGVAIANGAATLTLPASLVGDRRAQLNAVERFIADLTPGTTDGTRLLRTPVNLASSQTFSGNSATPTADQQAEFEVEFSVSAQP